RIEQPALAELDRDLALELPVVAPGEVDHPHAPVAEQPLDAVGADTRSGDAVLRLPLVRERLPGGAGDGVFHARGYCRIGAEQRLDVAAQLGIVTARLGKVRASRGRIAGLGGGEQLLDAAPALRRELNGPRAHWRARLSPAAGRDP